MTAKPEFFNPAKEVPRFSENILTKKAPHECGADFVVQKLT
jgi:hypothetical protein